MPMNQQAPAGWYPDGRGGERFWDGAAWTDHIRAAALPEAPKKASTFSKFGTAVKNAAADRRFAKEELARKQAEDALAAGSLVTSGVFGTSTVEVYQNGFVRVASWSESVNATGPKAIEKNSPFEKLRSIAFKQPTDEAAGESSSLEGAVGPAVAKLLKGGKGLMKASAPGMAAAGIAHVASNAARKSFLTIVTDTNIHSLTNQTVNSVGLKTSNRGHNDVGRALEAAGNAVLGAGDVTLHPSVDVSVIPPGVDSAGTTQPPAAPTLSERMRELAALHNDGILSDDEFAAAKAMLLGGL